MSLFSEDYWHRRSYSFMMRARIVKEEDGRSYLSYEPKEDCVWMFDDMQFNISMDAIIGHRSS